MIREGISWQKVDPLNAEFESLNKDLINIKVLRAVVCANVLSDAFLCARALLVELHYHNNVDV